MMVFGPVTASPAAKIPGTGVANSGSTFAAPLGLSGRFNVPAFALWPTAMMTVLQEMENSLPSTGTGRGRPLSSGGPGVIRMQTALPFRIRTGAARNVIFTPSSSASATSSGDAGMSSRVRR